MSWLRTAGAKNTLLVVLFLGALISVLAGAHDALMRSQDFQWSGARLLVQHIDPWAEELNGDPHHYIVLQQHPNYLPLLYVLLSPFGLLPMRAAASLWIVCNFVFLGVSCWCATRFFAMNRDMGIILTLLMFMATPMRLTVGNGQMSLLVLMVLSLSLLTRHITKNKAMVAGISYVKFNFAPAVGLYLLFRAGVRAALFSLLPAAVGLLLVWLWLGLPDGFHGIMTLIREPLAVSTHGYYPRGQDMNLMDVLEIPLQWMHIPLKSFDGIEIAVVVLLTAWLFWKARRSSDEFNVAQLGLVAFALYRHHSYDGTTLMFPFAFLLTRWRERAAQGGLVALGFILFGQRLIDVYNTYIPYIHVVDVAVMMLGLVMLWRLHKVPASGQTTGSSSGDYSPAQS